MSQQEGVVKFQLEFKPAPPLPFDTLAELDAWRRIMVLLELIGQSPDRYGGYGYGNISQRIPPFDLPPAQPRFVITGTQTGGLPHLSAGHYVTVLECYPEENRVVAEGPIRPSAESLTHWMVYTQDPQARWVMHAHSPHIWRHAAALNLPVTRPDVPYGTPEMAAEVGRLFAETDVQARGIFSMGGHEDGIIAFGPTAAAAGMVLVTTLAQAMALDARQNRSQA
ncbi:MAG: class II aldolase/adducin family protein [Chloroflexi bacterium]|nr:MAG: class II aldolase/adducin family protein [Chloroflexota bacterium]